jgi:hypothetical protein
MKTPEMEDALDAMARAMFGRGRRDSMGNNICVSCGTKVLLKIDPSLQPIDGALPFRDALSLKEYGISGLCMRCQDSVFGCAEPDDDDLDMDVDPLFEGYQDRD